MNKHEELLFDIVKTVSRYRKGCREIHLETFKSYCELAGSKCRDIRSLNRSSYIEDLCVEVLEWLRILDVSAEYPLSGYTVNTHYPLYPSGYFRKRTGDQ